MNSTGISTLDLELLELEIIARKGGPGSGNWGHAGRPGSEGGSVARGVGSGTAVRESRKKRELQGTFAIKTEVGQHAASSWTMLSAIENAKAYGFKDMDDLETSIAQAMRLDMENSRSSIKIILNEPPGDGRPGTIRVVAAYIEVDSSGTFVNHIGSCTRKIGMKDGKVFVDHDTLELEDGYSGRKLGDSLYARQIAMYREKGYSSILTYANGSVGRYAWAKRGFQYMEPLRAQKATGDFRTWAESLGLSQPSGGWPTFSNPQDVANYRVPGTKIHTSKLKVYSDVQPGDYDLGKAFMLDTQGHGSWGGEFPL